MGSTPSPRSLVAWRCGSTSENLRWASLSAELQGPCPLPALQFLTSYALLDLDTVLESGFRGLHGILGHLACSSDEETSEQAALAIHLCSAALRTLRLGFPLPFALPERYPPAPLSCSLHSFWGADDVDAQPKGVLHRYSWRPRALLDVPPSELRVLTRMIPPHIHHQRSQEDVGQVCWPAAPCLARWAVAHRALLAGRSICEIGAGMGLTGIAAGLSAALDEGASRGGNSTHAATALNTHCVLSDFNDVVLQNVAYNAALADPCLNPKELPASHALLLSGEGEGDCHRIFSIARHDWSLLINDNQMGGGGGGLEGAVGTPETPPLLPHNSQFDVILGSDMICSDEDVVGVVATLASMLRRPAAAAAAAAVAVGHPSHISPASNSRRPPPAPSPSDTIIDASESVADWRPRSSLSEVPSVVSLQRLLLEAHSPSSQSSREIGSRAGGPRLLLPSSSLGSLLHPSSSLGSLSVLLAGDSECGLPDDQGESLPPHVSLPSHLPGRGSPGPPPSVQQPEPLPQPQHVAVERHGGFAVFLLPRPRTRWGVEKLGPALTAAGFQFTVQPIAACFLEDRCRCGTKHGEPVNKGTVTLGDGLVVAPSGAEKEEEQGESDTLVVTAGGLEGELQQWFVTWA